MHTCLDEFHACIPCTATMAARNVARLHSEPSESPSAKIDGAIAGYPSAYGMECPGAQRYDMRDNSSDALHPISDSTTMTICYHCTTALHKHNGGVIVLR